MRFSFIGVLGLVGVLGDCQTRSGVILGYGNDISSSKVASQGDCCNKCNEAAECATWTFHTDGSDECWLHRVGNTTEQRSNVISGYRDGPAPPSSPWHACTGPKADTFKYCDTSLSLEARLDDLISRISLLDAGAQLTARESPQLPAIELPAYYWGTNAIHGLQNLACLKDGKCPTSFPAPCSLSASFNDTIVQSMGHVLGVELRAYFNAEAWDSLDTWSPTINLNRDPRWGRNVESPGEDPLVCGRYGTAYSLGLQDGLDPTVRMATVTLKHWIAYSIESYNGVTRHNVDVNVSAYDLANSYFPAWEKTVKEGGARGVMCSYNMLNGKPTCGNPELTAILRSDWGFKGYITSDSDSCSDIYKSHKFEPTIELATRDCLESGTDIDSGSTYKNGIESAVSQKIVNQSFVNQALRNSYRMRFEMGLFDPKIPNKYRDIKTDVVGSIPHQELSLHAARQGMVLLKNDGKTLPFSTGKNIAVIGQAVNDTASYTGNYDGPLCPHGGASCFPTIFEQVRDQNTGGVTTMSNSVKDVAGATKNVKEADLCVLVIDNAKDGGGEGHDRHTISLSDEQLVLANAVLAVGKPTVLVMINGGMISLDKLAESAPAILEAFMPGVHGAEAIADTIFGRNNPGGKLPVTMYPSDYIDKVDFLSMDMNNGPGRSYRYYKGPVIFPFGYGISFTTFSLKWNPEPPAKAKKHFQHSRSLLEVGPGHAGQSVTYTVVVKNTGDVAGDEVVLAFFKPDSSSLSLPAGTPVEIKRLFDYQRIHLAPGEEKTLTFTVKAEQLALVDIDGHKSLYKGSYEVVFSRGHGADLASWIDLDVAAGPLVLQTFRKWW